MTENTALTFLLYGKLGEKSLNRSTSSIIKMVSKKEDKKAKFLRAYANVPESFRRDIIIVVNKKPYTWDTAYLEIKKDSTLGKKMLKTLEEIGLL